jgi:hypothetical protein
MFQDGKLVVEPFVAWWIIQRKKNMHMLGAIEDRKPFWGVAKKKRCYYRFMLRLQERKDIDQP